MRYQYSSFVLTQVLGNVLQVLVRVHLEVRSFVFGDLGPGVSQSCEKSELSVVVCRKSVRGITVPYGSTRLLDDNRHSTERCGNPSEYEYVLVVVLCLR